MTWWQIAGALSPVLAVAATVIGAQFARKTGSEANRTADWSAFVAEHREWTEDRLKERDKRIDTLEGKITTLQSRLDDIEAKYRQAIAYIRRLVRQLQRHVEPDEIETPPSEITPDL